MEVPANSMGSSSAIAGQGAIDTFEPRLSPEELVRRAKRVISKIKNMNRKRQTNS